MIRNVGTVSWDSPFLDSKPKQTSQAKWLAILEQGDYVVRVVAEPEKYWYHYTPQGKVNCTKDHTCPVVNEKTRTMCGGRQSQPRFILLLIDRETQTVKGYETGVQVIRGIKKLRDEHGDSKDFDIIIRRNSPESNPLYEVLKHETSPLTTEEQQNIINAQDPDNTNYIDIDSKTKLWTATQVRNVLNRNFKPKQLESEPSNKPETNYPKPSIPDLNIKVNEDNENLTINWDD